MEISEREYLELKRRIEELENRWTTSTPLNKGWAGAVDKMPREGIRMACFSDKTNPPIANYINYSNDTWNLFVKLGKAIHETPRIYEWRRSHFYKDWRWELVSGGVRPKNFCDLSMDQREVSLNMLNELIAVYNKYFDMVQKGIIVRHGDQDHLIEVVDSDE